MTGPSSPGDGAPGDGAPGDGAPGAGAAAIASARNAARAFVKADRTRPVPLRLRNAPTALMKGLDYGKGYRYAHDEEGGFAAGERYWPDDMEAQAFYQPAPRGLEIAGGGRCAGPPAKRRLRAGHARRERVGVRIAQRRAPPQ